MDRLPRGDSSPTSTRTDRSASDGRSVRTVPVWVPAGALIVLVVMEAVLLVLEMSGGFTNGFGARPAMLLLLVGLLAVTAFGLGCYLMEHWGPLRQSFENSTAMPFDDGDEY